MLLVLEEVLELKVQQVQRVLRGQRVLKELQEVGIKERRALKAQVALEEVLALKAQQVQAVHKVQQGLKAQLVLGGVLALKAREGLRVQLVLLLLRVMDWIYQEANFLLI